MSEIFGSKLKAFIPTVMEFDREKSEDAVHDSLMSTLSVLNELSPQLKLAEVMRLVVLQAVWSKLV